MRTVGAPVPDGNQGCPDVVILISRIDSSLNFVDIDYPSSFSNCKDGTPFIHFQFCVLMRPVLISTL